jgi:hypothetical protein
VEVREFLLDQSRRIARNQRTSVAESVWVFTTAVKSSPAVCINDPDLTVVEWHAAGPRNDRGICAKVPAIDIQFVLSLKMILDDSEFIWMRRGA